MDDLQKSKLRSLSYWFIDGISEIGTGLVISLMGCLFLLLAIIPEGSKWNFVLAYGQPIFVVGAFFIVSKLVKTFKERITFPRTGYVSYIRPKIDKRIQRGIIAGSVAAAVSIFITLIGGKLEQRFVPLFMSALFAIGMCVFAVNYGVKRFYVLAVGLLFLGGALFFLNLPDPLDSAWFFIMEGIGMMLSGLTALIHYMKTTQPVVVED